jgi:hypothetical protein
MSVIAPTAAVPMSAAGSAGLASSANRAAPAFGAPVADFGSGMASASAFASEPASP